MLIIWYNYLNNFNKILFSPMTRIPPPKEVLLFLTFAKQLNFLRKQGLPARLYGEN